MPTMLTVISLLISFFITFLFLPHWINRAKSRDLVGKDVHKNLKTVPEAGGMIVVLGGVIGILFYIALLVFVFNSKVSLIFILAALCSIMIALMIGFIDDILGWRIGIRQRDKILISILIPIPLMVVNSGHSIMNIPFVGPVNLGLLYPLVIIPIGIIGSSNGFNMLAGYNGLEAGNGIIILTTLGIIAWLLGYGWVAVIALCLAAALIAFILYNWYPSKIFPGDTLTYPVGATIGIVAILANIEKFALFLFVLYFIEFLLKARGNFVPEWKAKLMKDGTLDHNGKWYTAPHVAISLLKKLRIKPYEYSVVSVILICQFIISGSVLLYFIF